MLIWKHMMSILHVMSLGNIWNQQIAIDTKTIIFKIEQKFHNQYKNK